MAEMKFIAFVVLLIFEVCGSDTAKFNISFPLSISNKYTSERKTVLDKVFNKFEDHFNFDLSNTPDPTNNIINIYQDVYESENIQFFTDTLLQPICNTKNVYINQIYNSIVKGIFIYFIMIVILLQSSKLSRYNYLVVVEIKYIDIFNNLKTFVKNIGFDCKIYTDLLKLKIDISSQSSIEASNTLILNFYTSYELLDEFYTIFTSSFPHFNELIHVSFYLDEYYTTTYRSSYDYSNTYIVSSYFQSNDKEEIPTKSGLNSNEYIDSKIYGTYLYLSFLLSLKESSDLNNEIIKQSMKLLSKNDIMKYKKWKIFDYSFIHTSYIGKINRNGNIVDIVDLNSDVPEYINDLWQYTNDGVVCINGKEKKENAILIGIMSGLDEFNKNYEDMIIGIVETVDDINSSKMLLNKRIRVVLSTITSSIKDKYDELMSNSVSMIIYYSSNLMYDELIELLNEEIPYIFTIGYNSGEICHPNIIPIGTNIPSEFHFLKSIYDDEKRIYLIYSNSEYGKRSKNYIERDLEERNKELKSVLIVDSNTIEMRKSITELKKEISTENENEIIVLCILGEEYTKLFIEEFHSYKVNHPNLIVYIMDLSENDFIDNSKWNNYYTIHPYLPYNPLPDTIMNRLEKYRLYDEEENIKYFQYLGSLSILLFNELVKESKSTDITKLNRTLSDTGISINQPKISLFYENYIRMTLSDLKTDNNCSYRLMQDIHPYFVQYPSYIHRLSDNTMMKCDWKYPNYERRKRIDSVICLYNHLECSTIFYVYTYFQISSHYDLSDLYFERINLQYNENNEIEYEREFKKMIEVNKPIAIYGYKSMKEKMKILFLLSNDIPLFSLYPSEDDTDELYPNLFNIGIETSNYIESLLPFDYYKSNISKYYYISNSKLIDQKRMMKMFYYFDYLYNGTGFEYRIGDIGVNTVDEVISDLSDYLLDYDNTNVIYINLYSDESELINERIESLRLNNSKIYFLRMNPSFLVNPSYQRKYLFISDYLHSKVKDINKNIKEFDDSILPIHNSIYYLMISSAYMKYIIIYNN